MSNITPDNMRGILIPYIGIKKSALWDAQSNFTQANSRSGIPEAQNIGTGLVLGAIGSQGENIEVETIEGGIPGEAQFVWRGEDSIDLGQDANNIVTESGYWKYSASSTTGVYFYSDCVSDPEGRLWVVSERVRLGTTYSIQLHRQEKNGSITLVKTFVTQSGIFTTRGLPCITRTQDGALLVAFFQYVTQGDVNIIIERSVDNGDTWKRISNRGLRTSIDTSDADPQKMRMVNIDSSVVLFIEAVTSNRNSVYQYVSRDGGSSFQLQDKRSQISEGDFHEPSPIALPDASIGLAWVDSNADLKWTKIPNAGIRATSNDWRDIREETIESSLNYGKIVSGILSEGNVCSFYKDGKIYVVAQEHADGRLLMFYSDDLGDSWERATSGGGVIEDAVISDYGSNLDRLTALSACVHEGRAKIFAHNTNSVWYLALSGFSTFNYPKRLEQPSRSQYMRWDSTYIPVMLPATSSQYTTTGAGTQQLDSEGLKLDTSGNIREYRYTHSGNYFTEGQVIRLRLQVDQNTSVASDYIGLRVSQDDLSTNSAELILRFSETTIQVRDNSGIKATISHDMTVSTEIVIVWNDTNAKIYYRTADLGSAKKWNLESISSIAKIATGLGNRIEWGHRAFSGVTQYISHWQEVSISSGEQAGLFDTSLRGALYPNYGEYIYLDGGLNITAKDSPARGEDIYKIEARYDYPIDNIFHQISLSPRITWRSQDDTATNRIPLLMDENVGSAVKSMGLSDVLGLYLGNINFQKFDLLSWNGSAWDILASIDTAGDFVGDYTLRGATIVPNGVANDFYLHYGEVVGWRAKLSVGEDTEVMVKIVQNSEGIWGDNTDSKQAVLVYDTKLTDPTTIPATGKIELIPPSMTFTKARLDGVNLGTRALAISIPPQATLEGYFQIGSMLMGSIAFPAPQYQRGRVISYEPNIQTENTLDGMFFSRKMSEGRRTVSIAWTEPIDTTRLYERAPDYWQMSSTSGALPVANYGDAPFLMQGIVRYLQNRQPIVYLPLLKKGTDEQLQNRLYDHLLCRTTGAISIESVLGEELENELFRVSTMNLEEIE